MILLVCYILYLIRDARNNPVEEGSEEESKIMPMWKCIIGITGGACLIYVGGDMTVKYAKIIAANLGMSETLIGLTIVSVGTSLPELVTSVVAAQKGESGLSLGNAIGSNIFNILFILGFSTAVHPINVTGQNIIDICFLIFVALFIYVMARISDKLSRKRGLIFILIYIAYLIYAIMR